MTTPSSSSGPCHEGRFSRGQSCAYPRCPAQAPSHVTDPSLFTAHSPQALTSCRSLSRRKILLIGLGFRLFSSRRFWEYQFLGGSLFQWSNSQGEGYRVFLACLVFQAVCYKVTCKVSSNRSNRAEIMEFKGSQLMGAFQNVTSGTVMGVRPLEARRTLWERALVQLPSSEEVALGHAGSDWHT